MSLQSSRTVDAVARPALTPTCVWRISDRLVIALDDRFGDPDDSYVNGSQVWLREDGPGGTVLEWRLHPVAGYRRPAGLGIYEVFPAVALAAVDGADSPAQAEALWDGLECFAAYGDELEPAVLRAAALAVLGMEPDGAGLVDHDAIGDRWERAGGAMSIVAALLAELGSPAAER